MASTNYPQKNKKEQKEAARSEFLRKTYEDVWQDRSATGRARIASLQASRVHPLPRAHGLDKNSDRVEKRSTNRKTVQAIGWVERPIDILIGECAREWNTSRSRAVARLIELGLENKILSANSHLLAQIVREAVTTECRRFFSRLTGVLFRMYLLLAQAVHLQRNIVSRSGFQKKLTPEQVDKIIAWSKDRARNDVVPRKNRDVDTTFDQAAAAWLSALDEGMKKGTGEENEIN
jgi:hypothetical protein